MRRRKTRSAAGWEKSLEKFLAPWRKKRCVIGALLTGSRAVNTHTRESDFDVHIVMSNDVRWRERGNKIIDGRLFEYFANPLAQNAAYHAEDYEHFSRGEARMFATGRILFDKTGELAALKRACERRMRRPLKKPSRLDKELNKYALWDGLDDLRPLWRRRSPGYELARSLVLRQVLETYRRHLGCEVPAPAKWYAYFTSAHFRRRQRFLQFKDPRFVRFFLACLRDARFTALQRLVHYVLSRMGGFSIDGWRVRCPALTANRSAPQDRRQAPQGVYGCRRLP